MRRLALSALILTSGIAAAEVLPAYVCRDPSAAIVKVMNYQIWRAENLKNDWPGAKGSTVVVDRSSAPVNVQVFNAISRASAIDPDVGAALYDYTTEAMKNATALAPGLALYYSPSDWNDKYVPAGCFPEGLADSTFYPKRSDVIDYDLLNRMAPTEQAAQWLRLASRENEFITCLLSSQCWSKVVPITVTVPTDRPVLFCNNKFVDFFLHMDDPAAKFSDIDRQNYDKNLVGKTKWVSTVTRADSTHYPYFKQAKSKWVVNANSIADGYYTVRGAGAYYGLTGPLENDFGSGLIGSGLNLDFNVNIRDDGTIKDAFLLRVGNIYEAAKGEPGEPLNCSITRPTAIRKLTRR